MTADPILTDALPPALEAENIHKRFGGLEVLKGISLTARDG